MSARAKIVDALVAKLKDINTSNGYNTDLFDSVISKHKFWDEVNQFPTLCVVGGQEEREYKPSNFTWGFYNICIKVYVKDGDDPAILLENLISDIEVIVKNNIRLEYDTNKCIADMKVVTIITDEGLLYPYGVGEVNISVQYQVL